MERFEASLKEIATQDNDNILNPTMKRHKPALAPDEAAERARRSIVEVDVGRSSLT
jgi:hypothetical protein